MGISSSSCGFGIAAAQTILSGRAGASDVQSRLPAAVRPAASRSAGCEGAPTAPPLEHVAAEIARSVESRLPGRVRELRVRVVDDHFVLSGASNSYYVKQVAQHLAMHALDTHMLGRLVNEIEVR